MDNKEHIYDEQISPLVQQLIKVCQDNGIPMFATFQFAQTGFCTSALSTGHKVIDHHRAMAQCASDDGAVNIDRYLRWVTKAAWKEGHSSLFLLNAGIPLQPEAAQTPEKPDAPVAPAQSSPPSAFAGRTLQRRPEPPPADAGVKA